MLSPTKNASLGGSPSPRKAVPLRGLFLDGVWRCNCPERPPAVRLQTKNHGVNHGRFFYTCQKPQTQQCRFFLWTSDAEAREKLAVLSNSHIEPNTSFNSFDSNDTSTSTPETPTKKPRLSSFSTTTNPGGLLTPQTDRTVRFNSPMMSGRLGATPQSAKARMMTEDTDEFEWDDADDAAVGKLVSQSQAPPPLRQPDFGAPKTPRTERISSTSTSSSFSSFPSPGKRKFGDFDDGDSEKMVGFTPPASMIRPYTDRGTSFSSSVPPSSMEFSMTPTPVRFRGAAAAAAGASQVESSELAAQAVTALERNKAGLTVQAKDELVDMLNKYELRMKGIIRGRDISRIALKKKDEQIEQLNARIAKLEGGRGDCYGMAG